MKKHVLAVACLLGTMSGLAQGTVLFNNSPSAIGGGGAKFFGPDGITGLGAGWLAQFYAGPAAGALAPVGEPLPFRTTGAGLGFINTTGADITRVISTVAPGAAADVQVRFWSTASGATFEAAVASGHYGYGSSTTLSLAVTGGAGDPPTLPVPLVGLQGATVAIPEPSTFVLGFVGVAAVWFRRRM